MSEDSSQDNASPPSRDQTTDPDSHDSDSPFYRGFGLDAWEREMRQEDGGAEAALLSRMLRSAESEQGQLTRRRGSLPGPPPLPEVDEELLRKAWNRDDGTFEIFMCPITHAVMSDPVISIDGYTYERSAIAQWFQSSRKSPVTGVQLAHRLLTPNHAIRTLLKSLIDAIECGDREVKDASQSTQQCDQEDECSAQPSAEQPLLARASLWPPPPPPFPVPQPFQTFQEQESRTAERLLGDLLQEPPSPGSSSSVAATQGTASAAAMTDIDVSAHEEVLEQDDVIHPRDLRDQPPAALAACPPSMAQARTVAPANAAEQLPAASAQAAPRLPARGVARAAFNGSDYGCNYLVLAVGDVVIQLQHPEADNGWAFGLRGRPTRGAHESQSTPQLGWFPEAFLDVIAAGSHFQGTAHRLLESFEGSAFGEDYIVAAQGSLVESLSCVDGQGWVYARLLDSGQHGWLPAAFLEEVGTLNGAGQWQPQ